MTTDGAIKLIATQKKHPYTDSFQLQWKQLRRWLVYAVAQDSPHLLMHYIDKAKTRLNLKPSDIISHGISTYDDVYPKAIGYNSYKTEEIQFSLWDIACIHGSTSIIPFLQEWFPMRGLADITRQDFNTVWKLGTTTYKRKSFDNLFWWVHCNQDATMQQDAALAAVIKESYQSGVSIKELGSSLVTIPRCINLLQCLHRELPNWPTIIKFCKYCYGEPAS